MAQDSSRPEFWETRYRDRVMPWDAGKVPRDLMEFLPSLTAGARVLVPGCGSAYEASYLAASGMDVQAIDFSPAAIEEARLQVGSFADRILLADFFEFESEPAYDAVYERAFLCALPPKVWERYAQRMGQLLRPGGLLAGFFFLADAPRGPPFGIDQARLDALLGSQFQRIADRPAQDSIPVFAGKERWQVWQRI